MGKSFSLKSSSNDPLSAPFTKKPHECGFYFYRSVMSRLDQRIENFNRAFYILSEAVKSYKSSEVLTHMALIQSFEVTFELAWKVLKDYLAIKGIDVYTPKDVIKEAFSSEILHDGQVWIDMLKDRNSGSHEYNIDRVSAILKNICNVYYPVLALFHQQIKDFHE